jgi:hypothetical protein
MLRAITAFSFSFLANKKNWLSVLLLNSLIAISYGACQIADVSSSLSDTGGSIIHSFHYNFLICIFLPLPSLPLNHLFLLMSSNYVHSAVIAHIHPS